jgi:hypothetical protein
VPGDAVTSSGSGLDPDISPENAALQVERVAKARNLAPASVRAIVAAHTEAPVLGFIGAPHVNVLAVNRRWMRGAVGRWRGIEEGSGSFLKNRTKKLLLPPPYDLGTHRCRQSFLVLFFKKEPLPFARL